MKIDIFSYKPFEHNNLSIKQNVLQIARNQNRLTIEGVLTSTLVYINAVDYIASHLLENLEKITYLVTYNEMNSIVFMNSDSKGKGQPLGTMIKLINRFEFPGKQDLIEELNAFNTIRIKVVHNLLSLTPDELQKIDTNLAEIAATAERIVQKYDTIVRGIRSSWQTYVYTVIGRMNIATPTASQSSSPIPTTSPLPTSPPPETLPIAESNTTAKDETIQRSQKKNKSERNKN